ncbi:MAG: LysM peptidoglycan-binding domain-containing protein [Cytophagales bacterium]|nr:MAG: LysM peptidoglycan-binding domain-containing protein [Cytophagales bacterium]
MKKLFIQLACLSIGLLTYEGFAKPTEDSLYLKKIEGKMYIVHKVDAKESLSTIATRYKIKQQLIMGANPHIKDPNAISANDLLFIPLNNENVLATGNNEEESNQETVILKKHTVAKGDNLTNIASKYSVSVNELKEWNQLPDDKIKIGQELAVSVGNRKSSNKNNPNSTYTASAKILKTGTGELKEYTVQPKDNLTQIAKKFSVSVDEIKSWNNLTNDAILVGQKLDIYVPAMQGDNTAENKILKHKVMGKETLYGISKKYNVALADLKKWNNITNDEIEVGKELTIYVPNTDNTIQEKTLTSSNALTKTHTVKDDETLTSIAKKYQVTVADIKKWNKLTSDVIKLDQKLTIYTIENAQVAQNNATTNNNTNNAYNNLIDNNKNNTNTQSNTQTQNNDNTSKLVKHIVKTGDNYWNIAKEYNVKNSKGDIDPSIIYNDWNKALLEKRKKDESGAPHIKLGDTLTIYPGEKTAKADVNFSSNSFIGTTSTTNNNTQTGNTQTNNNTNTQNSNTGTGSDMDSFLDNNTGASRGDNTNTNTTNNNTQQQTNNTTTNNNTNTSTGTNNQQTSTNTVETYMSQEGIQKKETGLADRILDVSTNKHVCLHRTIPAGEVIKVTNTQNGKFIYARVIAPLPDTGDNQGIIVRLSEVSFNELAPNGSKISVEISYHLR